MNPEPSPAIIEMKEVSVSTLWDVTSAVLENVSWTVRAGEFWVLAGHQKTGKSDFLMTTVGLMPPIAGTYHLFGREIRTYGEENLPDRLRMGFVFSHGQLFNELTAAENIALPLRYHRNLDEAEAGQGTQWVLELLELTPVAGIRPANLSRDWMKRVALARALVLRPEVLLCDDPLAGLGHRHRQWWVRFLDQLRQGHEAFGGRPMTVIVAAEDLSPWQGGDRRYALLQQKKFLPLGTWTELARGAGPALQELLMAPPELTV